MTRFARLDAPGLLQQLMARGIERLKPGREKSGQGVAHPSGIGLYELAVRKMAALTIMSDPSASVASWRGKEFASKNPNKLFYEERPSFSLAVAFPGLILNQHL